MDELHSYVFYCYSNLQTVDERAAQAAVIMEAKIAHSDDPATRHWMRRTWAHVLRPSSQAKALLDKGVDAFRQAVCERILHECADQIFLNYCPKCGALARTPQAKQCPRCFHSWRGGK
ncbi:MAG: hypothetical protein ABIY70_21735 [Capsulimonas sp.]|uniref:hypothetical protein n=1 Tax=Capsulimonas sp. TaxID=2494211 RepID=UPI003264E4E8